MFAHRDPTCGGPTRTGGRPTSPASRAHGRTIRVRQIRTGARLIVWVAAFALVCVVIATLAARVLSDADPPSRWFERNREHLDQVVSLVASGDLAPDGYYGPELPPELRHLSVTDRVSIFDDGAVFVPRWTRLVDDAGGFWHTPTSPAGRDMYGMLCADPVGLGDGWWACGMTWP